MCYFWPVDSCRICWNVRLIIIMVLSEICSLIRVAPLSYLLIGVKPTLASVHSEAELNTMVRFHLWFPAFSICVSNTAYFLYKTDVMTFKSSTLAWLHTFLRVFPGL